MTHDTSDETGETCWCHPEVLQPCPECPVDPDNVKANADCWRCGGRGLVPQYDETLVSLIVHRDAEEIIREQGL
jgi:hypothetical protein